MANKTMKAARIFDYGGPDQIVIEQVPVPEPGKGQVLIHVMAAGVNPADSSFRSGHFRQRMPLPFPWVPGLEGSGIVQAVQSDVIQLKPGQAVFGPINNSYAEYAVAPATDLFDKPELLSFEEAASVPHGALTAWQAVIEEAEVQPGQRVLVHGGAGGVGLHAVQLAKWKGAHVIATASSANADFVRSLGAEMAIDYRATKFEDVVHDVDAVIDTVGGEMVDRSLRVIRPGGVFVTVAAMVDPEVGAARGIRATSARRGDVGKLTEISRLLQAKQLVPQVRKVFPLEHARQAQELSETRHGRGRIVLRTA